MNRPTRIKITDLNPQLLCVLCGGYFMDATTIIECLHSFCKSCIVRYLETSKYCPICDVQIHKTKPLLSIRSDQTLQEIVYKLVPGLFQNEMKRRREFYGKHPQEAAKISSSGYCEERGEVDGAQRFVGDALETENISLSLEYCDWTSNGTKKTGDLKNGKRRYLHCPAAVTIAHLKKLVRAKYDLTSQHKIEMLYNADTLDDDFSLLDISYIYARKKMETLRLSYRIIEMKPKRLETTQKTRCTPSETTVEISQITREMTQTTHDTKTEIKETKPTKEQDNKETCENKKENVVPDKLVEENGENKDGQTVEEKNKSKQQTNNLTIERKRNVCKLAGVRNSEEKKRARKRMRNDDTVLKENGKSSLPFPVLSEPNLTTQSEIHSTTTMSTPKENGTCEVLGLKDESVKNSERPPLQINGNASSSDVIDSNETSLVDKENKQKDEFSNGDSDVKLMVGEKMKNGFDGEQKSELRKT